MSGFNSARTGSSGKPLSLKASVETQVRLLRDEIKKSKIPKIFSSAFDLNDRIDILLNEVRHIKCYLEGKIDLIEKMNLLMSIITYKIYELQHEFSLTLKDIKHTRENIMASTMNDEEQEEELKKLEKLVISLETKHHEKTKNLKQHKLDIQLEYETTVNLMDTEFETMLSHVTRLKEDLDRNLVEKGSDYRLVDLKISSGLQEIEPALKDFIKIQATGWKAPDSEDDILEKLSQKGLVVTKSGMLITRSGEKITYKEAEERKLLGGLDIRERMFPTMGADDVQFRDDIDIPAPPPSTDRLSECSRMSVNDMAYLKETLGKPLTLALAEIGQKQPRDPVHYLGHWLYKYRYNQDLDEVQRREYEELLEERKAKSKERNHRIYENEANILLMEMINRAENEVIEKEIERMLREQMLAEEEAKEAERIRLASAKKSSRPSSKSKSSKQ